MDLEVLDARHFTGSIRHRQAAAVGVCERHNALYGYAKEKYFEELSAF